LFSDPARKSDAHHRNAGKIAVEGSPQEKKVLAQKVFGSNLVLDCKKARGSCVKPWSLLLENPSSRMVERAKGIEPSCLFLHVLHFFAIKHFMIINFQHVNYQWCIVVIL